MLEFTAEQELIRSTVRRLARERIAPRAAEIDARAEFPWDIAQLLADMDLLSLTVPEAYGGPGRDLVTFGLVVEEVAQVCASTAMLILSQQTPLMCLAMFGTAAQKAKYLPRFARGTELTAFALTEPGAGSDALAGQTTAILEGSYYRLNGTKCFITNGGLARLYIVLATTGGERRSRRLSALLVEPETPGFSVGRQDDKMGMRGSISTEIILADALVPQENLLGAPGDGFAITMQTLDKVRAIVGLLGVGIAQGALDYAIPYTQQRRAFGQPIAMFQAIQFMLADMATEIEAARLLGYQAAALLDRGDERGGLLSAMAKCYGTDVAMRVTTDAVQLLGGHGYMRDHPLERMMRDAKATQIFEGTNQIQRLVVARHLLGRAPGERKGGNSHGTA